MQQIAVIDYGMSNLRSVVKALEHVANKNDHIFIADKPEDILAADRIVFPGQGAIGHCMQTLRANALDQVLLECLRNKPFLGLCLGLQTLVDSSEEDGGIAGLGVLPGRVIKFPPERRDEEGNRFKIPHMGWNKVVQTQPHPLWNGIESGERFYFVHSFYVQLENDNYSAGKTDYILEYTSAAAKDNFFAVQFHPEKSQRSGLQLLRNFLSWEP